MTSRLVRKVFICEGCRKHGRAALVETKNISVYCPVCDRRTVFRSGMSGKWKLDIATISLGG